MQDVGAQVATEWVGLQEAANRLGLSIDTVRRRAKKGHLRARQVERPQGHTWEVLVDETPPARVVQLAEHVGGTHLAASQVPPTQSPTQPASSIPDDQMLVPREAWQKALEQLGHLHQLAEQLADASARAAKAETTEGFLREQNQELRAQLDHARTTIATLQVPPLPPAPAIAAAEHPARPWWRFW